MSAGRFDTVVTDKLSTDSFSTIAPEYAYTDKVNISLPGHIIDAAGTTLTASRMSLNGGLKSPKSGDETVFSYKTYLKSYPLVVKRNVGEGEMYVLLFNDALTANFELAEFVYGGKGC